jgi:hypothetical protein
MNSYNVGDQVRLTATFADSDAAPADPTTVTCLVKRRYQIVPTTTTYTYPDTITKASTGVYYIDVVPSDEGIWDYRWVATGTVVAAEEGSFNVPDSQFF